jgi:ribonuclease G
MTEEILLNVTLREVRVALVENQILQEIHIERNLRQGLIGNIYKGKVRRLLPGIQAAFIDIGLERAAFLHVSDVQAKVPCADIRSLLQQGQEVLVQVYKDSLGSKGVRATTKLAIPSHYLVLTPGIEQVAVSKKITDENLRQRLLNMLSPSQENGYIFRTAAVGASQMEIEADKEALQALWITIVERSKKAKSGELVYTEIPMIFRVLRDLATHAVARIRVDQLQVATDMRQFAQRCVPMLVERIEYHASDQPIFDIYSIEDQLQKALYRKVYLKSGGHLIFDQTEAMTTIDVNTGSYLGQGKLEDTIYRTNLEAVAVIARQVRLRNLGGIIIIDFIDMLQPAHKTQLLQLLTIALTKDSARTEISELTSLGLVQMTRKRTRESLEHTLCDPCPWCQQRGSIKSLQTICYEILRELQQTARNFAWPGFLIIATETVINYLRQEEEKMLADIALQLGRPLLLRVESSYGREQYDILPLSAKE